MLVCLDCRTSHSDALPRWRCECGGRLLLETGQFFNREDLALRPAGIWRYREILGVNESKNRITLGEGATPLAPFPHQGRNMLVKMDFVSPSGSYKDRGSAVMISKLKEWGVAHILEDSSGNAGASVAAYAATAGIEADVFVPAGTSAGKIAQIETYGAQLRKVPGSREDTAREAMEAARKMFYASHNWSPYFLAGLKTVAYEIIEQMNWEVPEWVVTPLGNGGLFAGLAMGFEDLRRAGWIRRVPRLAGVQAERCAPVYEAWRNGLSKVAAVVKGDTAAEGISVAKPVRDKEVLQGLKDSDGVVLRATEDAIWNGLNTLGRKGIYVEPTSAVAMAGAEDLYRSGLATDADRIVLVLTGMGLKATDKIVAHAAMS